MYQIYISLFITYNCCYIFNAEWCYHFLLNSKIVNVLQFNNIALPTDTTPNRKGQGEVSYGFNEFLIPAKVEGAPQMTTKLSIDIQWDQGTDDNQTGNTSVQNLVVGKDVTVDILDDELPQVWVKRVEVINDSHGDLAVRLIPVFQTPLKVITVALSVGGTADESILRVELAHLS